MLRKFMMAAVLLFALLCSACSGTASSAPVSSSPAPTGFGAPYIVAMEKNGSNPQTILTLTTTQQMSNEFIGDETGLYFIIREIDPARPQESRLVL